MPPHITRRALAVLVTTAFFIAATLEAQATTTTRSPVDAALFAELKYRCVGPSRGGRATTVAGVAQRAGTFYMGSAGGGVWKTTNFGMRWTNVTLHVRSVPL